MPLDPKPIQTSKNTGPNTLPQGSRSQGQKGKPDFEALLPHDRMAEQSVLGAVILNNSALPKMADILREEDFFSMSHRRIFSGMRDLYENEAPIDELTLSRWLEDQKLLEHTGGVDYLLELAEITPVAENAESYAEIVREKAQLRDIITTAHDIAQQGQEGTESISDFIAESSEKLRSIDSRYRDQSYHPLKQILLSQFEVLEKLSEEPQAINGVPSGFTDLDNMTRGFQQSDLVILAARPSMGKTALAMNIGLNAATKRSVPVLIFSMEMPKEHIAMRLICSEASVSNKKMMIGDLDQDDWDKLLEATSRMMEAPLLIDDQSGISPNHIRKVARQAKEEYPDLGMIIVDYLQLMQSSRQQNSREQEIADISRSMKAIAKEFNLPVIALSQLNRDLERRADKRPMMSDLRESGALEQDADLILFIYRDEIYNSESEDKNIAEINLAKHRNGEIGGCRLAFIGQYTKFANLALGNDPAMP